MEGSLECNLELVDSWDYGATSGFFLTTHFPLVLLGYSTWNFLQVGLRVKAEPKVISSIYVPGAHTHISANPGFTLKIPNRVKHRRGRQFIPSILPV